MAHAQPLKYRPSQNLIPPVDDVLFSPPTQQLAEKMISRSKRSTIDSSESYSPTLTHCISESALLTHPSESKDDIYSKPIKSLIKCASSYDFYLQRNNSDIKISNESTPRKVNFQDTSSTIDNIERIPKFSSPISRNSLHNRLRSLSFSFQAEQTITESSGDYMFQSIKGALLNKLYPLDSTANSSVVFFTTSLKESVSSGAFTYKDRFYEFHELNENKFKFAVKSNPKKENESSLFELIHQEGIPILLNPQKLETGDGHNLSIGDIILIGKCSFIVKFRLLLQYRKEDDAGTEVFLEGLSGPAIGQTIGPIGKSGAMLGRKNSKKLSIPFFSIEDNEVSKRQCSFKFISGKFWLTHEGSKKMTYINSTLIRPSQRCPLKVGDCIVCGPHWLTLKNI